MKAMAVSCAKPPSLLGVSPIAEVVPVRIIVVVLTGGMVTKVVVDICGIVILVVVITPNIVIVVSVSTPAAVLQLSESRDLSGIA